VESAVDAGGFSFRLPTGYAATVREALCAVARGTSKQSIAPDPSQKCVPDSGRIGIRPLPLPPVQPERVVLISRKDPQLLAQAWEAGIVFRWSPRKCHLVGFAGDHAGGTAGGEIPPHALFRMEYPPIVVPVRGNSPTAPDFRSKRCKHQ